MATRPIVASWCIVLVAVTLACAPERTPPAGDRYTVRGRVEAVSGPGQQPERRLHIRHERIADFRGADGRVVDMKSMTMPFAVGEGVSLAGIEVGDIVELDFVVDWEHRAQMVLTRLRELPPDTPLDLEGAATGS